VFIVLDNDKLVPVAEPPCAYRQASRGWPDRDRRGEISSHTTHLSLAIAHLHPVHHDGDFFHTSLEVRFRNAANGEVVVGVEADCSDFGFGRCRTRAVMAVREVVD
jgi:hypothetical protein